MAYVEISEIRIYRDSARWMWSAKRDGVAASGRLKPEYGDGEESLVSALPADLRDSGKFVDIDRNPPKSCQQRAGVSHHP